MRRPPFQAYPQFKGARLFDTDVFFFLKKHHYIKLAVVSNHNEGNCLCPQKNYLYTNIQGELS